MNEHYNIKMEVSGKTAMWTRPDTGATPVSYPVPSWSATKGIFAVTGLEGIFKIVDDKFVALASLQMVS